MYVCDSDVTSIPAFPPAHFGRLQASACGDDPEYPGIQIDLVRDGRNNWESGIRIWLEEGYPARYEDEETKELHVFLYGPEDDQPTTRITFEGYPILENGMPDLFFGPNPDLLAAVGTRFGILLAERANKHGIPGIKISLATGTETDTLLEVWQYPAPVYATEQATMLHTLVYKKKGKDVPVVLDILDPLPATAPLETLPEVKL